MNTNIDMEKLQEDAVRVFTTGFACSESVIVTVREALGLDIPDSAIAMSSGFPWEKFGATCCGELIKEFPDRDAPERKCRCIDFVKFAVTTVAEILIREHAKDETD